MGEKLIELVRYVCGKITAWYTTEDIADALIANDVILVVRCKDCKHCERGFKCRMPLGASIYDNDYILVEPEDFCSYGERKDND